MGRPTITCGHGVVGRSRCRRCRNFQKLVLIRKTRGQKEDARRTVRHAYRLLATKVWVRGI